MIETLLPLFFLIVIGLAWSWWSPGGIDNKTARRVLSDTVYYLFLPALVLSIIWQTPLGLESLKISVSAAIGVFTGLLLSAGICRLFRWPRPVTGAVMLASAWPNATYLGLPVLQELFGGWGAGIAIQYDLFACLPLVLTIGVMVAKHFGDHGGTDNPLLTLVKVPPIWAAVIAITLNLTATPRPEWLDGLLQMLGGAVIPLMLISVGMALGQGLRQWRSASPVMPVMVIKLLIMPLVVWGITVLLGLSGKLQTAVVLEAAMPSMAMGLVLCDRFGLKSSLYAAAMTLTTLFSLATLPFWHQWTN